MGGTGSQHEQNRKNMERADLTVSLSLFPRAACCAHRGRPVSQLGFLSGMHTFSLERARARSLSVRAEFPVAVVVDHSEATPERVNSPIHKSKLGTCWDIF